MSLRFAAVMGASRSAQTNGRGPEPASAANISQSKPDPKNFAVPPNYFASPGLIPFRKDQLKVVGNSRSRCCSDSRPVRNNAPSLSSSGCTPTDTAQTAKKSLSLKSDQLMEARLASSHISPLQRDAHAQRHHLFCFAVMAIAQVAAERSKRRPAFSCLWPRLTRSTTGRALRAGLLTRIWRSLGLRERGRYHDPETYFQCKGPADLR